MVWLYHISDFGLKIIHVFRIQKYFFFQQLTIKEGTAAYNAFLETPVPVLIKFYFFDMVNPRELFHKHEKPILEERGPYTFR